MHAAWEKKPKEYVKRREYPSDGASPLARNILRRQCICGDERRAEMERRTQPGYEYHSCDIMDDGVYIDMNLLREYEDTGLTPEKIRELKERDTAKAAEPAPVGYGMICPICGNLVQLWQKHCGECGQRLREDE